MDYYVGFQAALHGYASFADFATADTMAGTPEAVMELLEVGMLVSVCSRKTRTHTHTKRERETYMYFAVEFTKIILLCLLIRP